jgi:type IV secretory pathway VirB2 component (pilin)
MPRKQLKVWIPTMAGAVMVMLFTPGSAHAAGGAGGGAAALPWEGPLNQVLASFTGPVAKALCILSIVVIGFGFAFSEGGGMRRMLGLLLGVSIAVTATSFGVSFFGFDGGAGW